MSKDEIRARLLAWAEDRESVTPHDAPISDPQARALAQETIGHIDSMGDEAPGNLTALRDELRDRLGKPRTWDMWAHDCGGGRFDNPGEEWWVKIHGLPEPVVPVTVTEVAGDAPDATHWGWLDAPGSRSRLTGVPCMIWSSKAAFGAQFPYGVAAEVEAGRGWVVRLRITARDAGTSGRPEDQEAP